MLAMSCIFLGLPGVTGVGGVCLVLLGRNNKRGLGCYMAYTRFLSIYYVWLYIHTKVLFSDWLSPYTYVYATACLARANAIE